MFNLGISGLLQQLCFASFAATVVAMKSLFHLWGERSDEVNALGYNHSQQLTNDSLVQVAWNPRYADGIFLAIRAE